MLSTTQGRLDGTASTRVQAPAATVLQNRHSPQARWKAQRRGVMEGLESVVWFGDKMLTIVEGPSSIWLDPVT